MTVLTLRRAGGTSRGAVLAAVVAAVFLGASLALWLNGFAAQLQVRPQKVTHFGGTSAPKIPVSITHPGTGFTYGVSGYNQGCGTPSAGDVCGTAGTGATVTLTIRKSGGNYYDGSAFSSASAVQLAATGSESWSYPLPVENFAGDGSYVVAASAANPNGSTATASATFTVDFTPPPAPTITSAPAALSDSPSAGFSFTNSESGVSFECSLDGADYESCTSLQVYPNLANEDHTFRVRSVDAAGNRGPHASHTWTVDASVPSVVSITRHNPSGRYFDATVTSLVYRVTFSEAVTGVMADSFELTATGGAGGAVSAVAAQSASAYDVTVGTLSGQGDLRLDLKGEGTGIANLEGTAPAGGFTGGQLYTRDTTVPAVTSIHRQTPSNQYVRAATTNLVYRVTFSEAVTGVATTSFQLTTTGSAAGTVSAVSAQSGSVYDVTINSLSGQGSLRLDLKASGTGVTDLANNAPAAGYTTGQTYIRDTIAPTGSDIQTLNVSGGTAGRAEAGDRMIFTYSEAMSPSSILTGWSGSSQAVRLRIVSQTGLTAPDRVQIFTTGNVLLPLGTVTMNAGNKSHADGTVVFDATMVQIGNSIQVTLTNHVSGTVKTASGLTGLILATMNWVPSASATDLAGNACSTSSVNESSGLLADADF